MPYADVYLIPIPKRNLAAYRKMARKGCRIWMKHGALSYFETVGQDFKVPFGGIPFPRMSKLKKGETLVAAWVIFKSKAHRDKVNAQVFKDPAMSEAPQTMPFDPKRFSYGGFKVLVSA